MANKSKPIVRINRLYLQALDIIERDLANISRLNLMNGEVLPSGVSKTLRDYVNLLGEMKEANATMEAEQAAKAKASVSSKSLEELEKAVTGAQVTSHTTLTTMPYISAVLGPSASSKKDKP